MWTKTSTPKSRSTINPTSRTLLPSVIGRVDRPTTLVYALRLKAYTKVVGVNSLIKKIP